MCKTDKQTVVKTKNKMFPRIEKKKHGLEEILPNICTKMCVLKPEIDPCLGIFSSKFDPC